MIQWVCDGAAKVRGVDRILVATDDARIRDTVQAFGVEAVMTPSTCPSGSDRVWRAVQDLDCDVVINLQGDEPAVEPPSVEALLGLMAESAGLQMGTLASPLSSAEDYENPNVVKVVLGERGRCLYFSRSPVPYLRDLPLAGAPVFRHAGVYAFRKPFLGRFASWPQGPLERAEALEQLRALENGVVVRAAVAPWRAAGVDSPEDVPAVEAVLAALNPPDRSGRVQPTGGGDP
jgi:3-deoxy-manno-octulosonate cytidylyltransferase (CMP-KDO synthetase)